MKQQSSLLVFSWLHHWASESVFTSRNLLLLQDPHAEEFEDKEWTFVIENVS